ncbi:IS1182 family transposase [Lactobacillus sp. ESL0684]|uniref:IS1182 family transposase n=1 Tax=Lactobacillus sp. ESL0684 TaxID=2983213 RepID=UPI0023F969EC|nr:IS1182 family transposase [Lactobacillus sp. ESL0684]WEV43135.1 IS1182 family transposase [Lactobacillus sp. ESL0684]WEV43177.1 IS1182 family transposase [Lactobacillus sp. ESL0684]WEV44381.1 IS1182 family transposase [Lactobacillus sp. ESL0684]
MYQNYITGQTALTLNFDFSIPKNHLAQVISDFVDSIPADVLLEDNSNTGRPAYHPAMMLKILLFAYSRRVFSGRKIERMLTENLPMMVIAGGKHISYHTINNFRASSHTNQLIKQAFVYFTNLLQAEGLLREDAIFIDGTKIEADANKYTFVWKRAVEKFHTKLKANAVELYDELIQKEVIQAITEEEAQTSQGLAIMAEQTETVIKQLDEAIAAEPKVIPGGSTKKRQRRGLKRVLHKLRQDFIPRAEKYEQAQATFGERNSYSKTDHDATFMHMKEDHMRNGQLKPGYNIQVATTNQYVVDYALYPNPTDFKTLEPFLKQMTNLDKFQNIVADAGYGSEYNYSMLENEYEDKQYFIPYSLYDKEQTRKYQNDPTKLANWTYNEQEDYYLDWQGVRFNFKRYGKRRNKSTGLISDLKIYEADEFQLTAELTELAKTKSGRQRQVQYNPNWQYLKAKAKQTLQSSEGKLIYSYRKTDVEPVFGHMKNVFGVRRTHLRGKKKVETDVGLMFMMMNLSKYWSRRGGGKLLLQEISNKKQIKIFLLRKLGLFLSLKS